MAKYKVKTNILAGRGVQLSTGSETNTKALKQFGLSVAQVDRLVENGGLVEVEAPAPEAPKAETPKAPKATPKKKATPKADEKEVDGSAS